MHEGGSTGSGLEGGIHDLPAVVPFGDQGDCGTGQYPVRAIYRPEELPERTGAAHACTKRNVDLKGRSKMEGQQPDARQSLYESILLVLMNEEVDISRVKNGIYVALNGYEVQERTTEIALISQERNEYLLKKFMIAKTVKGCTPRTLRYYRDTLKFVFDYIGKTVDDITSDDIRMYSIIRMKKDGVTEVTADNELRVLRSFYGIFSGKRS